MNDMNENNYVYPPIQPPSCNCKDDNGCMKTEYQYADVSIPVKISPDVKVGKIISECCGKPAVSYSENCCESKCELTLTQKIRIKIPIEYNVNVSSGCTSIKCSCPEKPPIVT